MDAFFVFGAKYLFIFSILIGVGYFLKVPTLLKIRVFIFGLSSLVLTFILGKVASYLFYNPRPFISEQITPLIQHIADNGFPSDHTLLVSSIAAIVTFHNKEIGFFLWFIAIIVGISRVYVGVHHVEDIMGSMFIALFATTIVYMVQKRRLNGIIASVIK